MTQVVSIVPTLMWLQHRLGHSLLGNEETTTRIPTQKTIEFSPNRNLQQSTKLDTLATGSFTDIEAGAGSDRDKEGNSMLESKELVSSAQ
jgi:hypothetical protein